MRRRGIATLFILVCTFVVGAPAALAHGPATVRVRTSDELIAAMIAANASGRPTVIRIAPGTYQFTQMFPNERGPSWLPPVTGTMALVAHDAAQTILSGNTEFARLLTVTASGALLVRGVTVTQGRAFCIGSELCAESGGGAALNAGGILWLEDCVIDQNGAFPFTFGGAIESTGGHLFVSNAEVTRNSVSEGGGGGIAVLDGRARIWRSTLGGNLVNFFTGNSSVAGGGLYIRNGTVWIERSSVSGNRLGNQPDAGVSGSGAGIFNLAGTLHLVRSAVTENSSPIPTGQFAPLPGTGGGIHNRGQLSVIDSTIGANVIGSAGGGLANGGTAYLEGVTVARNEVLGILDQFGDFQGCIPDPDPARPICHPTGGGIWNEERTPGTIHIARSIVALNVIPAVGARSPDCGATLISDGVNAIGNTADCTLQKSPGAGPDLLNVNPRLGDLDDNGDSGEAHFPVLAGSPVIDAGGRIGKLCSFRDQLGNRRVDGDKDGKVECDIGAIEFQSPRH